MAVLPEHHRSDRDGARESGYGDRGALRSDFSFIAGRERIGIRAQKGVRGDGKVRNAGERAREIVGRESKLEEDDRGETAVPESDESAAGRDLKEIEVGRGES